MTPYKRLLDIYDELIRNSSVKSSKFVDMFQFTGKSTNTLNKMIERDFKLIYKMFSIEIKDLFIKDDIIERKKAILLFKSNGFRYLMQNNPMLKRKDFYLRYQYIKEKDEFVKNDILNLISSNIEDKLSAIDSFRKIEKDEKVKTINKAILNNKQLFLYKKKNNPHIVNPLKIYYDNGYWYLASLKEDKKVFWVRIDRIKHIEEIETEIIYTKKQLDIFKNYQWDAFGNEKSEKSCTITLKLDNEEIYRFFKIKKYNTTQKEFIKDKEYFVEFEFNEDWQIKPLLFQWLDVITIVDIECKNDTESCFFESIYDSLKNFIEKKEHKEFFVKHT